MEHRVKTIAGGYHWFRTRAFARRDAEGSILRWYGLAENINIQKRSAEELTRTTTAQVTNVAVEVNNTFCTLQVTSLDQQPIVSSAKLLLIAGGAVENTGQVWNSAGTDLTSFGHAPTVIDQVRGTLTLRHLQAARAVSLQPLDGAGQPLGAPVQARSQGNDWALPLDRQRPGISSPSSAKPRNSHVCCL